MAKNGRFGLSLRILIVLAAEPDTMQTSAVIAEKLAESAVMVRRCFLLLHKRGLIEQRKGPNGGARLKLPAKQIGLGDIYAASEDNWLGLDEPAIAGLLKRARGDGSAGHERDHAGAGNEAHPQECARCEGCGRSGHE